MPNWKVINTKIQECLAASNPIPCLERLFAEYRDGMVAMELGKAHERAGDPEKAADWYQKGEALFPLEEYRARRGRLGGESQVNMAR